MHRRRLVLNDSDNEAEDNQHQVLEDEAHFQDPLVSHLPPNPSNPNPISTQPLEISDDDEDFVDVSDSLSPPSFGQGPNSGESFQQAPGVCPQSSDSVSGCPTSDSLRRLGLGLKREWLDCCARRLESSLPEFSMVDVSTKGKLIFEQFLYADMNYCGVGVLPDNVHLMHLVDLPGPYVLQIDEIVNISCPLRARYQKALPGLKRCLKLSMTDGVQRVFAMEYRPIHALEVLAPAGLKVAICNVHVHHGLLMLVPETIEVLGGHVEYLDAARQRVVDEVNKPPRGKRTRTGVLPPLATRATLAAWTSNGVDISYFTSNLSSVQVDQGSTLNPSGTNNGLPRSENFGTVRVENSVSNSMPNIVSDIEAMYMDTHRENVSLTREPSLANLSSLTPPNVEMRDTVHMAHSNSMANQSSSNVPNSEQLQINTVPSTSTNFVAKQPLATVIISEETQMNVVPVTSANSVSNVLPTIHPAEEAHEDMVSIVGENDIATRYSTTVSNIEDIQMDDSSEPPPFLSGEKEIPFTYLASLSAKWAVMKEKVSFVRGKVKCILTGVKGFRYKQSTRYELVVYIDDGSLITEILIDHSVVEKGIGYSPEVVTAAFSSSDTKQARHMKETLRKYQVFLEKFEGTVLVEMNGNSPLPVAMEMNQGCPQSDTWLLLRRYKSFLTAQKKQVCSGGPIELSP